MESVERHLWFFEYRRHGRNYIWWAYFEDRRAVEEYLHTIERLFPCVEMKKCVECKDGLVLDDYYFDYRLSLQARSDSIYPQMARKRRRRFFPLAPLTCDLLASFVFGAGEVGLCYLCGLLAIESSSRS